MALYSRLHAVVHSSIGLDFLNPMSQLILCPDCCVYTRKMMYFPSLFPLPYTKVTASLSLMLLPILAVSKLHTKAYDVCLS